MSTIATLPEEELQLSLLGDDERGYDFVTAETIEQLRKLSFPEARVFSLYLDMTPERLKDAPWTIRYDHLAENMRAQIADKDSRKMFDVVAENIKELVRNEYGRPQARGLALFAIPERVSFKGKHKIKYDVFIHYHLPEAPVDTLLWDKTAELTPLLMQMDEHEPTGVVLADGQHGRFFLYYLGEAAEYTISEWDDVAQRTRAVGMGAHNHEQWLAEQRKRHLRHLVGFIEKIGRQAGWRWLAIGGVDQIPEDLSKELPKTWRDKLIGTFALPLEANYNQVRDAAAPLVQAAEAQAEKETLEAWIGLLAQKTKAVSGLEETVQALQQGRIQTLLAAAGYAHDGRECQQCHALTTMEDETCPYCGGETVRVTDIVNTAVTQVFGQNGRVEIVRHPDNLALMQQHGNIGAILRF
ncbi:MAG TPA: hypothetical protein EYP41_17725 [Anaerolineae bacterium]|nr:hypothetical protein [Anaerolineae bacterium]